MTLKKNKFKKNRLKINTAGKLEVPPNWSLAPNRTSEWKDIDLWFLSKGIGRVETPEGEFNLIPGSCLIMRGGEPYTFTPEFNKPFVHYWMHFDYLDATGRPIPLEGVCLPNRFRQIINHDFIEKMLSRAVESFNEGRHEQAETWLTAILTEIEQNDAIARHNTPLSNRQARIEDICKEIDKNPHYDWSISDLSKKFCGCRSGLYRAFVARTGLSPQQYVITARMCKARMLLTESANDINWIAENLGYRDVFFFSRQFKKFHGFSPTKLRNRK